MLARTPPYPGNIHQIQPQHCGKPTAQDLCDEFAVDIVPKNIYPMPGQTRAVASIERLIRNHGEGHAWLVLCILAEGKGNNALIDETSLSAISSIVTACQDMIEADTSAFLELFDHVPIGPLMAMANELRGVVHQGHALAGMLHFYARRSTSLTGQEAARGVLSAARVSEAAKGRERPSRRHRSIDEKIAIGRRLLEVKASLPWGHWGPWVREKSGLSEQMVQQCMALA